MAPFLHPLPTRESGDQIELVLSRQAWRMLDRSHGGEGGLKRVGDILLDSCKLGVPLCRLSDSPSGDGVNDLSLHDTRGADG